MSPLFALPLLAPLGLLGCADNGKATDSGAAASIEITVEMSERIPTVATVSFDPAGIDGAEIRFGRDGTLDQSVVADVSDGETVVIGMKPATTYELQLVSDDGSVVSQKVEVTTGNLDNDLPELILDEDLPNAHSGGYVVTAFVSPPTALILDRDGDVVWWYRPEGSNEMGRVLLSHDGQRVLMGEVNLSGREDVGIYSVNLDGTDEQLLSVPWRHHDFLEHEDGTLAFTTHDPREAEGVLMRGDRILEIAPDGTETEIFNVWDHHEGGAGNDDGGPEGLNGWPHANALDYVPERDIYLISFRFMEGVAAVDRATGDELWFLGGSEATMSGPDAPLEFPDGQHGMQLFPDDSMLLFVNDSRAAARAVELQLDIDGGSFTETWRYEPGLGTPVLGDVQRLDDGHTLVMFSYNGELHELDETGALTWRLSASLGGAMGYITWVETLPTGG